MICALLLGREGSRGFPGKNLHPVLGRPMMAYPLLAAQHAPSVERTYLSTDSQAIRQVGAEFGANDIERPAELATPEALGEDAFVHGFQEIQNRLLRENQTLELLVLLFCNAPTITAELIEQGIEALRKNPQADSAVSVSTYNMWSPLRARRLNEDGFLQPFVPFETFGDPKTLNCDRDSQGDVYFADMALSVVRPRCLESLQSGLLPQRWMGQQILPIPQWGGCDVDFPWQIPGAEFWLKEHGFTEQTTPYPQAAPSC